MSGQNANAKRLVRFGIRMAWILRHGAKKIRLDMDQHGYVVVRDLIEYLNKSERANLTHQDIVTIVETNNKKRYEFDATGKLIRARQGHSLDVDVGLKKLQPPDDLFHGTARETVPLILEKGLLSMGRQHVHLTDNHSTAETVGKRHGVPIVIRVDAKRAFEDGVVFMLSNNNVWLCDHIERQYLSVD